MSAERELAALEALLKSSGDIGGWLAAAARLREVLALAPDEVARLVLSFAPPLMRVELEAAILQAFRLGVNDARRITSTPSGDVAALGARPSEGLRASVLAVDEAAASALSIAQRLARAGASADMIAAPILGSARSVAALTSNTVVAGGAEGVEVVARVARVPLLWVAETNACVHCLALSGTIARPGSSFDGSATYGASPLPTFDGPVMAPPRHPNCRCTLEPAVSPEFAAALRREADRSVLRGFSLESESMRVRVDAAERLLARGVDAPKSVRAFARGAVRKGEFPTRGRPSA